MSKKIELIEATSRVALAKGVRGLTLDAVAQEAKVSQCGLLYHYATKDDLVKAMNLHVTKSFRNLIEKHAVFRHSYHEAYLLATLDTIKENSILLDITTSLLAAISTNKEVFNLWREEYKYLNINLSQENYKIEYSLLVKSVCDGLWFSQLFDFGHIDHKDQEKIVGYLLDLFKKGSL